VRLEGNRATIRKGCKERFEAVREAIALCPVNPRGLKRCLSNRQDS